MNFRPFNQRLFQRYRPGGDILRSLGLPKRRHV